MPKRYQTISTLLALSITIYMGVGLFYSIVRSKLRQVDIKTIALAPVPQASAYQKPGLGDYGPIMERNIFGSADKPPEEVKVEDIDALEPTSLKVTLLGTVMGSPRNAFAVIEETANRKQGLYKIGDTIQDAVIKMILRGKVVLTVGDKDEILSMEESPSQPAGKEPVTSRPVPRSAARDRSAPMRPVSTPTATEGTIRVERSDVEESLTNINKLMSQVRIRPHFRDGNPDGLALSRIGEESLFSKLGLQDGDIVQAVDDKKIQSPDDVLALYKKLRSGSEVAIQIDRQGRRQTLNYRFE